MLFHTDPLEIVDVYPPATTEHYSNDRLGFEHIYLHGTGGTDSAAWLSTTSKPPVSAHRLIRRNGQIVKIVDDRFVAFTQGFGHMEGIHFNLNRIALSIELENLNDGKQPFTQAQLISCAKQVVEWHGLYGTLPILYHHYVENDKPFCPRNFPRFIFDRYYFQELKRYL